MTHGKFSINASISLLIVAETDLDKEQEEYVDLFNKSAELLLSLVNDILDFSILEAGKLELEPEPVNPLELIRD